MAEATTPRDAARVPANADREFPGYPEHYLLAAFDDVAHANQAIERAGAIGISTVDMVKYSGPEGAEILDSAGTKHGLLSMFERAVEWVVSDEDHLAMYEEKANDGWTIVGLKIPDAEKRAQAIEMLFELGATDIKHFGRMQVEVHSR